MKRINIFDKLTIGLFLISVFQLFSYEYFKEIKVTGKSVYKEFYITEDIYANSRKNLDDIRIIDHYQHTATAVTTTLTTT